MGFRLRIVRGKSEGKEFSFARGRVTVGRNHDNDLVLYDLNTSRHHFEIVANGKVFMLHDLGSQNGTRVNGKAAIEARLEEGDRIEVGDVEFEFLCSDTQPGIRMTDRTERAEVNAPESRAQREMFEEIQTYAVNVQQLEEMKAKRSTRLPARPRSTHKNRKEQENVLPDTPPEPRSAVWRALRSPWVYPGVAVVAFGLLFGAFLLFYRRPPPDFSAQRFSLGAEPDRKSYGAGRVEVPSPSQAQFSFIWRGGRAILGFTAGAVDRPGEVELSINGMRTHTLAVTGQKWGRPVELKLDRRLLALNQENSLVFSYQPATGQEARWGVRDLSLIEEPFPAPSMERARELMRLGDESLTHKKVHPGNLATAEVHFHRAILAMEGFELPPPEYGEAESKLKTARNELASILESGMFKAERAQQYGKAEEAESILRELLLYLPDEQDRRRTEVLDRLALVGKK